MLFCVHVCVCVFNTTIQAFTPKVITRENLCHQSLFISLSCTGLKQEGMIRLHSNVFVHKCVLHKWRALCGSANTKSKRPRCPPAQPAAPVFIYRYLLSGPLFPLFSLPELLKKLGKVFISQLNPYSRYPCQRGQWEGASGDSMFGLGQSWVKL